MNPATTRNQDVELVCDARAALGEGPLWSVARQQLFWVDIEGCALHCFDPRTSKDAVIPVGSRLGAAVERENGGLLLATQKGFVALDPSLTHLEPWSDPEAHIPNNRFNDGKVDPQGRFWAGTMAIDFAAAKGSLYCLHDRERTHTALTGVSISNGLAWSLDHRTFYYIDTPRHEIDAFDYDLSTGAISNRRRAVAIDGKVHGGPDGMCIDAEGMLWVAHWGGSRVNRWDPRDGRLLQTIPLPVSQVTSCAFGGPRLDQLYITSARGGLKPDRLAQEPHAGSLFRYAAPVSGLASVPFRG